MTAYEARKIGESQQLNLIQHRIQNKTEKIHQNIEAAPVNLVPSQKVKVCQTDKSVVKLKR